MITKYIAPHLLQKYEFHNYGHALEILHEAFPQEWEELQSCLSHLSITTQDIIKSGGNESPIPKKFDDLLYPLGWREIRITGDLLVNLYPRRAARRGLFTDVPEDQRTISGYIDGHNIDFIKNKVAFDLEWNSKDQTFDRDLLAMRTYFDCGLIEVGIIVTRSEELNDVFRTLLDESGVPLLRKYGENLAFLTNSVIISKLLRSLFVPDAFTNLGFLPEKEKIGSGKIR